MSRALILMYHAVDEPRTLSEARYCVTPASFRAQMAYLADSGRVLLPLATLAHTLRSGKALPGNTVAVTFDDGFECFHRNALPVLTEFKIPATLFAVAGMLGESNTWIQAKNWPERRLMDARALGDIYAAGITVGCHALSHRRMTQLTADELFEETAGARRILSDALGVDVTLFAYPHGDQGERERRAVAQAGFFAACGTESGFNRHDTDLYALRRIDVYGSDSLTDFRRKLEFGTNCVTHRDILHYYLSRLVARRHD